MLWEHDVYEYEQLVPVEVDLYDTLQLDEALQAHPLLVGEHVGLKRVVCL